MNNLTQRLDEDRKVLTHEKLNQIEGEDQIIDANRTAEDLYYVLTEKQKATLPSVSTTATQDLPFSLGSIMYSP